MFNTLIATALTASLLLSQPGEVGTVTGQTTQLVSNETILASESLDLGNRHSVPSVSEGFKENILIALGFLQKTNGEVLVIHPSEVFAFHNKGILPKFAEDIITTQESDFTTYSGYKVVAGLGGNGVCHLASLMNKVGTEAGLEVTAPINHNFARIPGIEPEYGTSISTRNSPEKQNLYLKNQYDFPVKMQFILEQDQLYFMLVALDPEEDKF